MTLLTLLGGAGVASGNGTATPSAIALTVTVPAPTASGGAVTSPAAIARTVTVPAPTATGGGTSSPAAIARTVSVPAPTSVTGGANTTPTAIARTVVVPAPTASGGATTSPAAIALTATVGVTVTPATTTSSTTPGTSLQFAAGTNFATADTIVVCIAADNAGIGGAGSIDGVQDDAGNTYTARVLQTYDPVGASAGQTVAIYTAPVTNPLIATDTITVDFEPTTTSKAIVVWKVVGFDFETSGVTTGSNTATPTVTTSSVDAGHVVIAVLAAETNATVTADADTSNGVWSTQLTAVADTGTADTSARIASQYKLATAAGTQTYNPTVAASDNLLGWIAFYDIIATGGATTSPSPVALTAVVPDPTASGGAGGDGTATPAAIALTAVTPAPTVTGGGTTSPAAVALTATTPAPTVTGGANTTPAAITLTTVVPDPTATGGAGGDGNATPASIALTVSVPAPTVTGGATTAPVTVTLTATLPAPTVSGGSNTAPATISLSVTVPAPTVTGGATVIADSDSARRAPRGTNPRRRRHRRPSSDRPHRYDTGGDRQRVCTTPAAGPAVRGGHGRLRNVDCRPRHTSTVVTVTATSTVNTTPRTTTVSNTLVGVT